MSHRLLLASPALLGRRQGVIWIAGLRPYRLRRNLLFVANSAMVRLP